MYYKRVSPKPEDDNKSEIAKLAGEHPTYGYRRLTAMLHRQGHKINNKRVRRLMSEMGLVGKCPKKHCRWCSNQPIFLKTYPQGYCHCHPCCPQ